MNVNTQLRIGCESLRLIYSFNGLTSVVDDHEARQLQ